MSNGEDDDDDDYDDQEGLSMANLVSFALIRRSQVGTKITYCSPRGNYGNNTLMFS